MKKKNRVLALVALLSATFAMALTSPVAANAAGFEETYVGEKRSESNLYGGMIMPQTTVAISTETGYTLGNTEEPNADTGRIYYLKNSHGDVIGQMDENGNLLTSYGYNAFGEQISAVAFQGENGVANRFLYAGEQYDETSGLYYLRARHYDVSAGRFTQEDTYLGDGRNLYAYVHSNPLKYVDPTGHIAEACEDDGTHLDDRQDRGMDGGVSSPVLVNYNGTQTPVYRGGSSFTATNSDVRFDSMGNVKTTRGISVNVNPTANTIIQHGGAYQVQSMPNDLKLVQTGKDGGHYEIVPTNPMSMSTYQSNLNEIVAIPYGGQ